MGFVPLKRMSEDSHFRTRRHENCEAKLQFTLHFSKFLEKTPRDPKRSPWRFRLKIYKVTIFFVPITYRAHRVRIYN
jgi:hypothetical protein